MINTLFFKIVVAFLVGLCDDDDFVVRLKAVEALNEIPLCFSRDILFNQYDVSVRQHVRMVLRHRAMVERLDYNSVGLDRADGVVDALIFSDAVLAFKQCKLPIKYYNESRSNNEDVLKIWNDIIEQAKRNSFARDITIFVVDEFDHDPISGGDDGSDREYDDRFPASNGNVDCVRYVVLGFGNSNYFVGLLFDKNGCIIEVR